MQLVMNAIQREDTALKYVSPRLQNDEDIAMAAVRSTRYDNAFEYVSPGQRNNKEIALVAVNQGMAR